MPRGGKKNYKGRSRQFTSAEELESQRKQEEQSRNQRKQDDSSSEEDDDSASDDRSTSVIDVNNPNRVVQKTKKLSELDSLGSEPVELSRREKEEIARQQSAQRYQQLHAEGKTDEARADLARLAIVRKQREEAAKKREAEKKEKESRANATKEASLNAIKSKSGGRKRQ